MIDKGVLKPDGPALGKEHLPLNRILWLLITVCRGRLPLSIISSSLSSVLISVTLTRESSFIPTTELLGHAAPQHATEDAGNHRLVKHLRQFAADIEGPQSLQSLPQLPLTGLVAVLSMTSS
ncbi:hypothetical protein PAMP_007283 [Pampus punctatissimus]